MLTDDSELDWRGCDAVQERAMGNGLPIRLLVRRTQPRVPM